MAQIAHDAIELAELQMRLVSLDCQRAQSALFGPVVVLALGLALAACVVPIALIGVALFIQAYGQTSLLAAFWWTALAAIVLAIGLCGGAVWWLRRGARFFESSRTEWSENIRWLKNVLDRASRTSAQPSGNGNYRRGNEQSGSAGRTI
jgi:hypothetical protein